MNNRNHYPSSKTNRRNTKLNATKAPLKETSSGATVSKGSQLAIVRAWLTHHQFSSRDSLLRLLHTPWQSLLTWMTVAIALVLPAALYLGLTNAQQLGQGWQSNNQISAFVVHDAKPLAIKQLQQRLLDDPEIQSVDLITPEEAKQSFQQHSGLGDILHSLDSNPLPAVLTLIPTADSSHPDQVASLQSKLATEPLIELVQIDIAWLHRLNEMMNLAQRIVLAFAVLLALGVLLIIGNTIRLTIENRREEIIVVKMVGGTDGFVRRPFLYTGLWYGLGGGLLASLLLLLTGYWLNPPIQQLLSLYESDNSLTWLDLQTFTLMIVASGSLGWLGAWLSVTKHLKNIEPS